MATYKIMSSEKMSHVKVLVYNISETMCLHYEGVKWCVTVPYDVFGSMTKAHTTISHRQYRTVINAHTDKFRTRINMQTDKYAHV
jgi:hypothetical protein